MNQYARCVDVDIDGRRRVVIASIKPQVNGGRFPVKRVIGQKVAVTAHVFSDGHDRIAASLLYRTDDQEDWIRIPMQPLGNDRWGASFTVTDRKPYLYTVEGQIDRFATWREDLRKKTAAGQKVSVDLQIGSDLVKAASGRASGDHATRLSRLAEKLTAKDIDAAVATAVSEELSQLMSVWIDRSLAVRSEQVLPVEVDRKEALFSTWYEFFPRSFGPDTEHGTFSDAEKMLPHIAEMGFDIVYLPPIHPIGKTNRKGQNNSINANPEDPGSPWAIGGKDGGHTSVHPDLGTLEDFDHFVTAAGKYGLDVAMDIAFQCSPDHPWIKEHPEWFVWRPDKSIQFAENPPKRYEDIVPLNFETDSWKELWEELRKVFAFWAERGVRIFRVDNPHTKPFAFWQWVIEQIKADYPDTIFLSEAFTRPQVMARLAKLGFTQSYTYFTWRNSKVELTEYLTQLTATDWADFFRPNFWPNTPDILPEYLQYGGRSAFLIRLALAATLSSNYGVYGPAFELCEHQAVPGKEEYLNSEKYEIKDWDVNREGNIGRLIRIINTVRSQNEALQQTNNLQFHEVDNEYLLCYSKTTDDLENLIMVLVNLDPFHKQTGWVSLPLDDLGIDPRQSYLLHDLVSDDRFMWQGERNFVSLDPNVIPFHVFRVHRRMRREQDFDYYM